MGCLDPQVPQIPVIVQGDDGVINIQFMDKQKNPVDITGVSEITCTMLKGDGSFLTKTLSGSGGVSVISAPAGKIQVVLAEADTLLLKVTPDAGPLNDVEVTTTIASKEKTVQLKEVFQVNAKLFPPP